MKKFKLAASALALALIVAVPGATASVEEIIVENENVSTINNDIFSHVNSGLNEAIGNGLKGKIKTGDALIDGKLDSMANETEIDISSSLNDSELNSVIDVINKNDGVVDNILDITAETGQNIADDNGGIDEEHILNTNILEESMVEESTEDFIGQTSEEHTTDLRTEDTFSEEINQEDTFTHVGEGEIETGVAGVQFDISTVLNSAIIKIDRH